MPYGSRRAFTTAAGGRVLFVCSPSGDEEEMFLGIGAVGLQPVSGQLAQVSARFGAAACVAPEGAGWRSRGLTRQSGPVGVDGVLAVGEHGRS